MMPEERAGKARRKSPAKQPRATLYAIKGQPAWKAWVDELAAFDRLSVPDVIDRALVAYARSIGFGKLPPER
jgi:hypothetical protein